MEYKTIIRPVKINKIKLSFRDPSTSEVYTIEKEVNIDKASEEDKDFIGRIVNYVSEKL